MEVKYLQNRLAQVENEIKSLVSLNKQHCDEITKLKAQLTKEGGEDVNKETGEKKQEET